MSTAAFGRHLKDWRRTRRLSQLDLALMADVSTRHVSFLETGRARPSRDMVLRLARTLEVPLKERNDLLTAAGFALAYRARDLSDDELQPLRAAIEHLLSAHDPYPAYVVDRYWDLLDANTGARRLLGGLVPETANAARPNMARLLFEDGPLRQAVVNWDEVARLSLLRLRREARDAGGDARLTAMVDEFARTLGNEPEAATPPDTPVIAMKPALGGVALSVFTTMTAFSTAQDAAISDLRIEHVFPADAATDAFMRSAG